jgi:aminoglycoside phosphotransferase (APT) family kinase protein
VLAVPAAQTHDLSFTDTEVRKRYAHWERGEPDREWACLTLLDTHARGVAPAPLRRETDPDGTPVVVMTRLPGDALGDAPLTTIQTDALGRALRRAYDVPVAAAREAGVTERIYGPGTLPGTVTEWLGDSYDLAQCRDPDLVRRAVDTALTWLAEPEALPEPRLSALGISDRKPANLLWDGHTCRLVDFEDSGLSDPAYELADSLEHIAGRLAGFLDPEALVDAVGLSPGERERVRAYRPLWASFWLAMLLPGNGGFRRNPPGTTEAQAGHLLALLG